MDCRLASVLSVKRFVVSRCQRPSWPSIPRNQWSVEGQARASCFVHLSFLSPKSMVYDHWAVGDPLFFAVLCFMAFVGCLHAFCCCGEFLVSI